MLYKEKEMSIYTGNSEDEAIAIVKLDYPGHYVHCFGCSAGLYDIAVYLSEADFSADADENDNKRMVDRVAVSQIS